MKITVNNEVLDTPSPEMNVRELLEWRNIPSAGTAVAVDNKLVPRDKWDSRYIKEDETITIISAAFGG